jgi:NAD-dependent SIR2 family protein deacetylase
MTRHLGQIPELPQEIVDAAARGELVFFVGAGISKLAGLPSWGTLASGALELLRQRSILNYQEIEQLKDLDPRTRLSVAQIISKQSGVPLELTKLLQPSKSVSPIYDELNKIGCACVTTNYDELLQPRAPTADASGSSPISVRASQRIFDASDFESSLLDSPGTVIHLHGAIGKPQSMIVTTSDYLRHYEDPKVRQFLKHLFARKTVLFLGYGLSETEVLEYILRRGEISLQHERRRFALQGYFSTQKPLYESLADYYEQSFGLHLIGFDMDQRSYGQQVDILKLWSQSIKVQPALLAADLEVLDEVLSDR